MILKFFLMTALGLGLLALIGIIADEVFPRHDLDRATPILLLMALLCAGVGLGALIYSMPILT